VTALEAAVRLRHGDVDRRPWQRHGVCASCGRTHGEDGRPLWLTGARRTRLICLECFDLAPASRAA
jgi:hypothetical protein